MFFNEIMYLKFYTFYLKKKRFTHHGIHMMDDADRHQPITTGHPNDSSDHLKSIY